MGMEDDIRRIMLASRVPGAALYVVDQGQVVLERGFGETGKGTGDLVTTRTVFEAASLTKPIFACLVLKLSANGLLDLDRPIADYLQENEICADQRYKRITPRHVLCHSGGFQNWRREEPLKIHFTPGTAFKYSGEGYVYLQRALESLTGEPLERTVKRSVLDPLALTDSSMIWSTAVGTMLSNSFSENGDCKEPQPLGEANAAYSLYTSLQDYAHFVMGFLNPVNSLLKPESLLGMLTPQVSVATHLGWSLGWGVIESSTQQHSFWHWGDNGNFKSFVWFDPVGRSALLMFTNSANGLIMAHAVARHMGIEGSKAFSDFLCPLYQSQLLPRK